MFCHGKLICYYIVQETKKYAKLYITFFFTRNKYYYYLFFTLMEIFFNLSFLSIQPLDKKNDVKTKKTKMIINAKYFDKKVSLSSSEVIVSKYNFIIQY